MARQMTAQNPYERWGLPAPKKVEAGDVWLDTIVAGSGPPLLLVHGYPQTKLMWRHQIPALASRFTVVAPDLRGYGDSDKPPSGSDHAAYSKRAMAGDLVALMGTLGFDRFSVAGHDRGARATYRLALDHADKVERVAILDIVPTLTVFDTVDQEVASAYYHWFFLIQPKGFPERLIGADPDFYLRHTLGSWSSASDAFEGDAFAEYLRCFSDPATITATCEDYRAGATIDLAHDRADWGTRIEAPLLVLWGLDGLLGRRYDVLSIWWSRALEVRGEALPCGHFLPEERPADTLRHLWAHFAGEPMPDGVIAEFGVPEGPSA